MRTPKKKKDLPVKATKKLTTVDLRISKLELEFLRDVFSVRLPVSMQTVSQSLAASTGRQTLESLLWVKLSDACARVGLALNDQAPDFLVTLLESPPLGVFQVPTGDESQEAENEEEAHRSVFPDASEEKK